jgi:hypothetical protein
MNRVLDALVHDAGITDPHRIHQVVLILLDCVMDSAVRASAEEISQMDMAQLKKAIQQVQGGF